MKISVEWETDGEKPDVPKIVEIPDELITDYLSDEYGWLVKSWTSA